MEKIICYRYVDENNFPRVWGSGKTKKGRTKWTVTHKKT